MKARNIALQIPNHLANNLDKYDIAIESEDDIAEFMWNTYETYEGEQYADYNTVKAYLNPLTKKFVVIQEDTE